MPHGYEVMRDKFSKTMSLKKAKKKAAMIWNSKHKGAEAVGPHRESIQSFCNFMEDNETMGVGMITPMDKRKYTAKDKESTTAKGPNYPMDHRDVGRERGGMAEGNEENEQGLSGAATSSKDLKLQDFKVKSNIPSAPKTLTKSAAALKKFTRDKSLRNSGAIFGGEDEVGDETLPTVTNRHYRHEGVAKQPGPEHDEMFRALAAKYETPIIDNKTVGVATGAALSAARKKDASHTIAREIAKHESFTKFMEAYLDQNARRAIRYNLKSIAKSRNIDLKRGIPAGDVEDAVASKLRTNADAYRAGSKPWDPQDQEIENHYHKLADKRQNLAIRLKGK